MELYTSLTQLKMAMNGGQMPPMTPLTDYARKYLDPEFTIGMGAVVEDEVKGLRCPMRGCGGWYHNLSRHAVAKHRGVGGAKGIRALLSIPHTAPLMSASLRAISREGALRQSAQGRNTGLSHLPKHRSLARNRKKLGQSRTAAARTVGVKNLRDQCEAQLKHRLIDLHHKLGRSPSRADASKHLGNAFVVAAERTFGTWNSLKSQCGLEVAVHGYTPDQVTEAIAAYYRIHGHLPSAETAQKRDKMPLFPHYTTVLRAFGLKGWPEAMAHVAWVLGIDSPRYGTKEAA